MNFLMWGAISGCLVVIIGAFGAHGLKDILDDSPEVLRKLFTVSNQLSQDCDVDQTGFRLVINQGDDAGQEIEHLHMHLMGGQKMDSPRA